MTRGILKGEVENAPFQANFNKNSLEGRYCFWTKDLIVLSFNDLDK